MQIIVNIWHAKINKNYQLIQILLSIALDNIQYVLFNKASIHLSETKFEEVSECKEAEDCSVITGNIYSVGTQTTPRWNLMKN